MATITLPDLTRPYADDFIPCPLHVGIATTEAIMKQRKVGHIAAACSIRRLPTIPEDRAIDHSRKPPTPFKVKYVRFVAKEQDKQSRFYRDTRPRHQMHDRLRMDSNTTYNYIFAELYKRTWDKCFTREEKCDLVHFTATMSLDYNGIRIEATANNWRLARQDLIAGQSSIAFTYEPVLNDKSSIENVGKTVGQ